MPLPIGHCNEMALPRLSRPIAMVMMLVIATATVGAVPTLLHPLHAIHRLVPPLPLPLR